MHGIRSDAAAAALRPTIPLIIATLRVCLTELPERHDLEHVCLTRGRCFPVPKYAPDRQVAMHNRALTSERISVLVGFKVLLQKKALAHVCVCGVASDPPDPMCPVRDACALSIMSVSIVI